MKNLEVIFEKACNEQDQNAPTYQAMLAAWKKLDEAISRLPDTELKFEIDMLAGSVAYRAQRCGFFPGTDVMSHE